MLTIESLFFFPGARALGKPNVASPLLIPNVFQLILSRIALVTIEILL